MNRLSHFLIGLLLKPRSNYTRKTPTESHKGIIKSQCSQKTIQFHIREWFLFYTVHISLRGCYCGIKIDIMLYCALLSRSHLQDLKDVTHNIHYETYRVKRLNESNANGLPLSPLTLENGTLEKSDAESHLWKGWSVCPSFTPSQNGRDEHFTSRLPLMENRHVWLKTFPIRHVNFIYESIFEMNLYCG